MEMREKIARALFRAQGGIFCQDGDAWDIALDDYGRRPWYAAADAVLEAMREPTPEMIDAGKQLVLARTGWPTEHAEGVWQAMIDAARTKETV